MSGRPLRFLGGIVGLWTLGRIAVLLPSGPVVEMTVTPRPPAASHVAMATTAASTPHHNDEPPVRVSRSPVPRPILAIPAMLPPPPSEHRADTPREGAPVMATPPVPPLPPAIPTLPQAPAPPQRWSASLWAIARDGGQTLLPGGQLGGTQAGVRLLRRMDSRGDLSASLRLSTPWQGIGREVAMGLDWRPLRHVPVHLLVEQRLALDSGRNGSAALIVTGIGPRTVAPGVVLAGYAQAGAVVRTGIEPFADGAARVGAALSPAIDLGLGLWGGVQRDAQRLDIGPTMGIAVPVANRRIRLSLDWRQRVAGRAAPGSGPALTMSGDF